MDIVISWRREGRSGTGVGVMSRALLARSCIHIVQLVEIRSINTKPFVIIIQVCRILSHGRAKSSRRSTRRRVNWNVELGRRVCRVGELGVGPRSTDSFTGTNSVLAMRAGEDPCWLDKCGWRCGWEIGDRATGGWVSIHQDWGRAQDALMQGSHLASCRIVILWTGCPSLCAGEVRLSVHV